MNGEIVGAGVAVDVAIGPMELGNSTIGGGVVVSSGSGVVVVGSGVEVIFGDLVVVGVGGPSGGVSAVVDG